MEQGRKSVGESRTGAQKLEQQFVVDEWRFAVGCAADFAVATLRVEGTGSCFGIEGVETDCICGTRARVLRSLFEQPSADPLALDGGRHRHVSQIKCLLTGVK